MADLNALTVAQKLRAAAAAAAQVRAAARQTAEEIAQERQATQTLPAPVSAPPGQSQGS